MSGKKVRLSEAVDEYMGYLQASGSRPNTIKGKRTTLNHLRASVGQDIYVSNLSHHHVDAFFASGAWAASTHNLYRSTLSQFHKWCVARRYHTSPDMMSLYRNRRVTVSEKTRIHIHQWPALFAACEHPMDRMIVALGLFLFLRGGEMTAIKFEHIDLDGDVIRVWREKPQEWDTMPIATELRSELLRYMKWYTEQHGPIQGDWYLVPRRIADYAAMRDKTTARFAKGVDPNAALAPRQRLTRPYKIAKPILERAGYDTAGEGAHTLRRSGARALFDELRGRGYDGALRRVQSMLGHKNAKMTEHYLGLTIERLQRNEELAGASMFTSYDVINGDGTADIVDLSARRSGRGEDSERAV